MCIRVLQIVAACLLAVPPLTAAPPNVVLLIGDDQAWSDYGFLGHPTIRTPHLDKLASQSLVFPRGYVPSSLCRPSLATMMTGLFPHQHGITSNDPPLPAGLTSAQSMRNPKYLADRAAMVARFERSPNLATILTKAGYLSLQSGKWWEGNSCRCGFTDGMTHGDTARGGRHGDEGLTIGREGLKPVYEFFDRAKKEGKPFFLWYAPMMPHQPHNPPARLLEKYKAKTPSIHVAKYWAMCEWFDETIGDVLARLDENGQAENTIVVYLNDNGWIQDPDKPAYAPKSKQSVFDGGIRTPILIRRPGITKPESSERLAHSIDVAPTVLTACGLKPTAEMQGINLLDPAATAKRDTITGETFLHNAKDIARPGPNLRHRWIIEGHWKLTVPDAINEPTAKPELYDLKTDPAETRDRHAAEPAIAARLLLKLDAWWKP